MNIGSRRLRYVALVVHSDLCASAERATARMAAARTRAFSSPISTLSSGHRWCSDTRNGSLAPTVARLCAIMARTDASLSLTNLSAWCRNFSSSSSAVSESVREPMMRAARRRLSTVVLEARSTVAGTTRLRTSSRFTWGSIMDRISPHASNTSPLSDI